MENLIKELGLSDQINGISTGSIAWEGKSNQIESISPVDGKIIGTVRPFNLGDTESRCSAYQPS